MLKNLHRVADLKAVGRCLRSLEQFRLLLQANGSGYLMEKLCSHLEHTQAIKFRELVKLYADCAPPAQKKPFLTCAKENCELSLKLVKNPIDGCVEEYRKWKK